MAAATRHPHRLLARGDGRVFAKFAVGEEAERELLREMRMIGRVRAIGPRGAAPRCKGWDETLDALLLDPLEGDDLAHLVAAAGSFTAEQGHAVGTVLGRLHTAAHDVRGEEAARSGPVPVHRPGPEHLLELSGGGLDLLPLVQGDDALCAHLDRVGVPSVPDTLIHGDLRAANVMMDGPADPTLVDWECGGAGEARWDVACLVADRVSAWLHSVPSVPGVPPGDLLGHAELPMDRLRPGITAFTRAHAHETRSWLAPDDGRLLELTAMRLVHLGFDAALESEGLRGPEVAHVQVAANMFARPAAALPFLGLPGRPG